MLRMAALAALVAVFLTGEDRETATLTSTEPLAIFKTQQSQVALTLAERAGGLIEVAATVTPHDGQVRTLRLQMYDGEAVTIAIPGGLNTTFELVRDGVEIRARMNG